jgi:spore coat protein U domain-containing protein, fimbrial subunit CupE1/2/3/6
MPGSKNKASQLKGSYFFFLMLMAAVLGTTASTLAGSASAPLFLTATVVRSCSLSTTPLGSGNNDPIVTNANVDLTVGANISVACTRGSISSLAIAYGRHASRPVILHATTSGAAKLYAIPKDSALTQVRAAPGSSILSLGTIPMMRDHTLPVHLRIPAGQNVSPGSDKNTVIVTVNF